MAFESSYAGGVRVAIVPARHGNPGYIIAATGSGREQEVRVFNADGKTLLWSTFPYGKKFGNGLSVTGAWSDRYERPVVAVSVGAGQSTLVKVYGVNDKKLLAS